MAGMIVVLIILGCVAYQYLKGTLFKGLFTIIITICASVVAFGYFEILADVFVSRSGNTRYASLVPWAQPLSFVLLFVLAFAVLRTIADQLTRQQIDFGLLAERIGRVICGIFLGVILSGLLLTALAMAPLPNKYPYQRFDQRNPNPEKPNKVFLNADGFATGCFSIISKGSFSGKKSFAALHPNFLDQVFLNRHSSAGDVSIITSSQAIEVPGKKGGEKAAVAWPAPEDLKDAGDPNKTVSLKTGHNLTIVRVGIKKSAVKEAGKFTLSQLRLICKQKGYAEDPLAGKGKNIYPVGYLKTANQLQIKKLNDRIEIKRSDFKREDAQRWLDFAFYIPNDLVPALVEFKLNSIAEVPPLVSLDRAPPAVPFVETTDNGKDSRKLQSPRDANSKRPRPLPERLNR